MKEEEDQLLSLMVREMLETMDPQQPVKVSSFVHQICTRPPFDELSEEDVRDAVNRHCEALGRSCQ